MNILLNYLKSIYKSIILFLILIFILSLLYYFEILNLKIMNIIIYIITLSLLFILGYKLSKIKRNKGYLNGFIVGLIITILFSLLTLIISKYSMNTLIYYLTLILSSITGGIIGINKK